MVTFLGVFLQTSTKDMTIQLIHFIDLWDLKYPNFNITSKLFSSHKNSFRCGTYKWTPGGAIVNKLG